MTLTWANPGALWGLSALIVPILVHLTRRTEQRITPFAAMRWLSAAFPPRRRVRVSEWLLLLLRLLLITAVVLWWARPTWIDAPAPSGTWVLVSPDVDPAVAQARVKDQAQWRWLAPQFPALASPAPKRPNANASLLREFDTRIADDARLIVFVPEQVDGLDAERIRLRHAVEWQVLPAIARDEATPAAPTPVIVGLRIDASQSTPARYLRAAVQAWNASEPDRYRLDEQPREAAPSANTRWLLVLGGELTPAQTNWVEAGGVALIDRPANDGSVSWRDDEGRVIASTSRLGRGRVVHWQVALTPTALPALLDADFPARLRALLEGEPAPPTRAIASTVEPLRDASLSGGTIEQLLTPWLLIAIAVLFALERLIATGDRKAVA